MIEVENLTALPKTREEARAINSMFYFTGIPCLNGHLDARLTSNMGCRTCRKLSTRSAEQLEAKRRQEKRQHKTEDVKKKTYPKGTWSKQYQRIKSNPTQLLKNKVKQIVKVAIYKGDLKRQPCEVCGSTYFIHAHHEDYSKPLEVRWLCSQHHQDRHREIRAMEKMKLQSEQPQHHA